MRCAEIRELDSDSITRRTPSAAMSKRAYFNALVQFDVVLEMLLVIVQLLDQGRESFQHFVAVRKPALKRVNT